MKRISWSWIVVWMSIGVGACDYAYSPFESRVDPEYRNTTQLNLEKLKAIDTAASRPFKVALLSDTHYHFEEFREAIDHINRRTDISFIIVTGDITENGLLKEFELFHQIMSRANKPYLTVIGNHDYLSNGADVYRQMYGDLNYVFTFHNTKFIAFDNVFWEGNKTPNFPWFDKALISDEDSKGNAELANVIPLSHIPPSDGQMANDAERFHDYLKRSGVRLSIHGHKHEFSNEQLLGDGIQYVTIGSPQKRNYAELHVDGSTLTVTKVVF